METEGYRCSCASDTRIKEEHVFPASHFRFCTFALNQTGEIRDEAGEWYCCVVLSVERNGLKIRWPIQALNTGPFRRPSGEAGELDINVFPASIFRFRDQHARQAPTSAASSRYAYARPVARAKQGAYWQPGVLDSKPDDDQHPIAQSVTSFDPKPILCDRSSLATKLPIDRYLDTSTRTLSSKHYYNFNYNSDPY